MTANISFLDIVMNLTLHHNDTNTSNLDYELQSPRSNLHIFHAVTSLSNKNNNTTQRSYSGSNSFLALAKTIIKATIKLKRALFRYEITPTWKLNYLHILMAITAVLIVVLNTYVISLFIRKKNLRKESNLFLLSLTVSDELVGLIVIPLFIVGQKIQGTFKVSTWPVAQQHNHISYIFLTFCSLLGISNLCVVTLDRYCHLCSPFKYQQTMTKAKAFIISFIIWTCCLMFALSSFIYYYPIYEYDVKERGMFEIRSMVNMMRKTETPDYQYKLVLYSIFIALSVAITVLLIKIFAVIIKNKKQTIQAFHQGVKRRQEIKSAVILTIMFGIILVWLAPVFCCFLGQKTLENSIGMNLGRFVISIINPILFTLFKTDFRKIVKDDKMRLITLLRVPKKKLMTNFEKLRQEKKARSINKYEFYSGNEIELRARCVKITPIVTSI